jgi:hypothetical protein
MWTKTDANEWNYTDAKTGKTIELSRYVDECGRLVGHIATIPGENLGGCGEDVYDVMADLTRAALANWRAVMAESGRDTAMPEREIVMMVKRAHKRENGFDVAGA